MIVLGCEGKVELILIENLIKNNHLKYPKEDILDRRPIHFRQPRTIAPIINALPSDEKIIFCRIGDTQKEDYDISCFKSRIDNIEVIKICTKPEIEILIIINEGLMDEYLKTQSKIRPKQFVKNKFPNLDIGDYINNNDLYTAIKEYKRIKKHKSDEHYLLDLLK